MLNKLLTITLLSLALPVQADGPVILYGKAQYCALQGRSNAWVCVDHTLAQCLRTLYMTDDGVMCETRKKLKHGLL